MVEVEPERFEAMVTEALDGLPDDLGELMSNVAVTVQHDGGPRGLLGLITIYRLAICAICDSDAEVVEQVRRTVIHEVGHHFGIGDRRLRELGW